MHTITLCHTHVQLLPERALFWPEQQALILADPHFGKGSHFRSHGIYVPEAAMHSDLLRLQQILHATQARHCIILGDFFHSTPNHEFAQVCHALLAHTQVQFYVTLGNHDRHTLALFQQFGIHTTSSLVLGPFTCLHTQPETMPDTQAFYLCGHIHPAIKLAGPAKQNIILPCFYQTQSSLVLPAFGSFTGNHVVKLKKYEKAYIIANDIIHTIGT